MLQAIDEPLDLIEYNRWNVFLPEGQFLTQVGSDQFEEVLQQVSPSGIPEWRVGIISSKASCSKGPNNAAQPSNVLETSMACLSGSTAVRQECS